MDVKCGLKHKKRQYITKNNNNELSFTTKIPIH